MMGAVQLCGVGDEQDVPSLRSRPAVAAARRPAGVVAPDHLAYFISDVVDQLDPRFREGRLSLRSRRVTSRKDAVGRRTIRG